MAIRQKTIEYAWPTDAVTILGFQASSFTSSLILVSVPETSSRVFKSVWVETFARDTQNGASRATTTDWFSDISIGGVTQRYFARSNGGQADTGEHYLWSYVEDLTNYFSSSFTGSAHSMSYTFWYSGSGGTSNPDFTNFTKKLYITYDYDDVQNRQVKTIRIPIEYTGSIKDAMQPVPTSQFREQIPALNVFCPETNKSFKQIWINFEGTDKQVTTGTIQAWISASIDNGKKVLIGHNFNGLASLTATNAVMDISDINTATTHSLWMCLNSTGTGTDFTHIAPTLNVTYEYDHNDTSRSLNSLTLGLTHPGYSQYVDGINEMIGLLDIYIPESNVQLRQSGILHYISATATSVGYRYVCNESSSAAIGGYLRTLEGTYANAIDVMRFDSQSMFYPRTASFTPTTGHNTIRSVVCMYANPHRGTPPNSIILLNYESDRHALGDGVHNKTVKRLHLSGSINGATLYTVEPSLSRSYALPESDYYINYYGVMHSRYGAQLGQRIPIRCAPAIMSGDFSDITRYGAAFSALFEDSIYSYSFAGEITHWNGLQSDTIGNFRRYPNQATSSLNPAEGILNPQLSRSWYCTIQSNRIALWDNITYHSILYPLTGSISSYSGDGSGITVGLHDAETGKVLKYTTSSLGGAYTMSWHDRSRPLYVEAYQDATHTGRSVNAAL